MNGTTKLTDEQKDAKIKELEAKVAMLEKHKSHVVSCEHPYFASKAASIGRFTDSVSLGSEGLPASHCSEIIKQFHECDYKPRLNTSSYVNVVSEPEEQEVSLLGAQVNLADASVYPASIKMHDSIINIIAKMWNAPEPTEGGNNYCGAGTVGSTEACLLAGLALKFRWRKWYANLKGLDDRSPELLAIRPNLVISTCYQAAWEKFFRYFEIDAKFAYPNLIPSDDGKIIPMSVDAKELVSLCDEHTIGVVGILGNHYNGAYDPIWDINDEVTKINKKHKWQVGIHVDAASGGFIAPFQDEMGADKPFDFRNDNVLSMSTSGHKFGESTIGTGWVVFRQREDLAEHIAVTVTYLGGHSDSMTLNFSRPASGVYVQLYKLLRLGKTGYRSKVDNQMNVAKYLRNFLKSLRAPNGKPRFQILDGGETCCLPVVTARLNPELKLSYDDIDLQHALSECRWYVSGYALSFENFMTMKEESLVKDVDADSTMFRIVCKSNLTMSLAEDLRQHLGETIPVLDSMADGYHSMHSARAAVAAKQAEMKYLERQKSFDQTTAVVKAAAHWKQVTKKRKTDKIAGGKGSTLDTKGKKRAGRRFSMHPAC